MSAVTKSCNGSVIDIPFLVRGRVVMPGSDAVEFGGRTGARFRTPDASHHAGDLVLRNAGELRDLADVPTDEILDFLAELGPRLSLDRNDMMRAAHDLALEAGELTEPVLGPIYDQIPGLFERSRLDRAVETVIGKAYLDGWVEVGTPGRSSTRLRAVGSRNVHVIAGNVPMCAAITVIRSALTKGDSLIKMPSNDPFTAAAIGQSMIDLDPDHPVTRHFAVAYWKGGDAAVERDVYRPSRIEKLTAWGGMDSMRYIQRYLVPGIELIAMNPKLSISIIGREALQDSSSMEIAAAGVARMVGRLNQTACTSTRVAYVECDTSDRGLTRLEEFGKAVHDALLALPESESTAPKAPNRELEEELEAIALDEEFYRVFGDTSSAGVVVSRTEEAVEFARHLTNRVVNLVPVADIRVVPSWVNDETQKVGIYPESLRRRLRDDLSLHGAQQIVALGSAAPEPTVNEPDHVLGLPQDGTEPMRRMVRWMVDHSSHGP